MKLKRHYFLQMDRRTQRNIVANHCNQLIRYQY
nr:MAG TPA: hypothetical protein [Bacteriophage sp.]